MENLSVETRLDRAGSLRPPNVLLHCGTQPQEFGRLAILTMPPARTTWQPVPHDLIIRIAQRAFAAINVVIGKQVLARKNHYFSVEAKSAREHTSVIRTLPEIVGHAIGQLIHRQT